MFIKINFPWSSNSLTDTNNDSDGKMPVENGADGRS
jgi:hypothetical protein